MAQPEQPEITSHLSGAGDGDIPGVNPQVGNYTTTVIDATVDAVGPALAVTRTYNSQDLRSEGAFGAGWSSILDQRIRVEAGGGTLLLTMASGRQLRFGRNPDGTYASPAGKTLQLVQTTDSYVLRDTSGGSKTFNLAGELTTVTDAHGREQHLTHTGGHITALTDAASGRSIHVVWAGDHVTSVYTDAPVAGGTPPTWTYTHNGDRLVEACTPLSATSCTTYTDVPSSFYQSIVKDDNPVIYYPLDETTGTTAVNAAAHSDERGDGLYNEVTLAQPGTITGANGTSVTFGGTRASSLVLPDDPVDGSVQTAFELWFKAEPGQTGILLNQQNKPVTSSSNPTEYSPLLYIGTDGVLRSGYWMTDDDRQQFTTPTRVDDGVWHHVILTSAVTQQWMYFDGALLGTQTGRIIDHIGRDYFLVGTGYRTTGWIGTPPTAGYFSFAGQIDDVSVYKHTLSGSQAAAHYTAGRASGYRLATVTEPGGMRTATIVHDATTGRLTSFTDRNGATWALSGPSVDGGNRVVTISRDFGEPIVYRYDIEHDGRPVSRSDSIGTRSWEYNVEGFRSKTIDEIGQATAYATDERGNILAVTTCRAENDCQTRYAGYYLNEQDPLDPRNDQVVWTADARSTSAAETTYRTTFELNTAGQITKTTYPLQRLADTAGTELITYTDGTEPAFGGGTTPPGLIETTVSLLGGVTTYTYYATGDIAETTDPAGLVTRYTYDDLGRATTVAAGTKAGDVFTPERTTITAYNAVDLVTSVQGQPVINPITGVTHTPLTVSTYDDNGRLTHVENRDTTGGDATRATTYTYDAYGRPASTTGPDGYTTVTEWNTAGDKAAETTRTGLRLEYLYDDRHRLLQTTAVGEGADPTDPLADRLVLETRSWYANDLLAATVDANGTEIANAYYADGRLRKTSLVRRDPATREQTQTIQLSAYTYDAAGNVLTEASTSDQLVTTNEYDARGFLYRSVARDDAVSGVQVGCSGWCPPAALPGFGEEVSYQRDPAGNVVDENHYLLRPAYADARSGYKRQATYDTAGRLRTNSLIRETSAPEWLSDSLVGPTSFHIMASETTTYTYTTFGQVATVTDPAGAVETRTYNAVGLLSSVTSPPRTVWENGIATDGVTPVQTYGYNTFGEPTHMRDVNGGLTSTTYDLMGRPTATTLPAYTAPGASVTITPTVATTYNPDGQAATETGPRGGVTSYTYDLYGRRTGQTGPDPDAEGALTAPEWTVTYDRLGRQIKTVDPVGAITLATWDELGNRLTATATERVDGELAYLTTAMAYDYAGRLVSSTDPTGRTTSRRYYSSGHPASVTAANGDVTTYEYGAGLMAESVTTTTSRAGVVYTTRTDTVDALGRPLARQTGNSSERFAYDDAGRLVEKSTYPETTSPTRYGYDDAGQLTSITSFAVLDGDPVTSGNQYGHPVTVSLGYDRVGHQSHMVDGNGNATEYTFNALGLQESTIEPATAQYPDPADRTWTSVYDAAGDQVALHMPGGVHREITRDMLGRITAETGGGAESATAAKAFTYTPSGRTASISGPNGVTAFAYNDRGLLTGVSGASTAAYTYDAAGRVATRTDAAGTATFAYDQAGNLQSLADPLTGATYTYSWRPDHQIAAIDYGGAERAFTYEPDTGLLTGDALSVAGTVTASVTYEYDTAHRLTAKTVTGLDGAGTNTYAHDGLSRLTSWTGPGGAVTTYGWDDASNRTSVTTADGTRTSTYNERNQLLAATGGGAADETWTYTARGTTHVHTTAGAGTETSLFDAYERLGSVATPEGTAAYTYDALDRIAARNGQAFTYNDLTNNPTTMPAGVGVATVLRGPGGEAVSRRVGGAAATVTWNDRHTDTIAQIDPATGAVAESRAYSPFGETTGSVEATGFQGGYTDPLTGETNAHARWYDADTGRFTSWDTWQLEASVTGGNRYAYGAAAPLRFRDPGGHSIFDGRLAAEGSAGAIGATRWWPSPNTVRNAKTATGIAAAILAIIAMRAAFEQVLDAVTELLESATGTTSTSTKFRFPRGHVCFHMPRMCEPPPSRPPGSGPEPPPTGGGGPLDGLLRAGLEVINLLLTADRPDTAEELANSDDETDINNGAELENGDDDAEENAIQVDDKGNITSVDWSRIDQDCANTYYYEPTPKHGAATQAIALLCGNLKPGTQADSSNFPPGFEAQEMIKRGVYKFARCHLIAAKLGGDGYNPGNIVTCYHADANNSVMKKIENAVYKAVMNPADRQRVVYLVTPIYDGGGMPVWIKVRAIGSKGFTIDQCIKNAATRVVYDGSRC